MATQNKPRARGRPSKYSKALGERIAKQIMLGKSLRSIEAMPGMPTKGTMINWLAKDGHEFLDQYARAREIQAEIQADEMVDIADDAVNDYMESLDDKDQVIYKLNGEHIQRSKLRIDVRKYRATQLAPKAYGNKQQVEHSGSIGHAITVNIKPVAKNAD